LKVHPKAPVVSPVGPTTVLAGAREWGAALPGWLLVGLALGVVFTAIAAGVFLAGTRVLPEPERRATGTAGDDRRRAEIREYLSALGERFAEDHPVEGGSVAFYLPERDVAITFDAKAFFRIEGSGTHPVLVEHELPGGSLGARLPFETPDPTPDGPDRDPSFGPDDTDAPAPADPGPDPVAAAFAELGVPEDADRATVRDAYRSRVKEVHPDQGGDAEAFRRLRQSYAVAREATESAGRSDASRAPGGR
jgi:hypothetical protein